MREAGDSSLLTTVPANIDGAYTFLVKTGGDVGYLKPCYVPATQHSRRPMYLNFRFFLRTSDHVKAHRRATCANDPVSLCMDGATAGPL